MVPAITTASERSAGPEYLDRDGRRLAYPTGSDPDGRPVVRELGLVGERWPFDLADVSVPVTVLQGTRDTNVAPETGTALAERLPDATLGRAEADQLGTLCTVAGRALSGPTPV